MEHQNPFSYAEFLRIFEHDDWFLIDETVFYLDYAPDEEYYLGCLREYEEPYWAGYCDISEGGCFRTASALLNAKIFHGRSVKERWENVRFFQIGGLPVETWLELYEKDLPKVERESRIEELYGEFLLWNCGFHSSETYLSMLDTLLSEYPENALLLKLQKFSESRKVTCRLFLHHWNYESVSAGRADSSSYAALGKYLFSALQKQYEGSQFSPETYSIGCFCLWHYLPEAVKAKEPFSTLCRVKTYWDRNDTQAWKLLQQAFAFYDSGTTA